MHRTTAPATSQVHAPGAQAFPHLQEDESEFLEESKLRELVGKYSEFIDFPIYLYGSKEVDVEAPEEEEDEAAADDTEEDDISDESTEGTWQCSTLVQHCHVVCGLGNSSML